MKLALKLSCLLETCVISNEELINIKGGQSDTTEIIGVDDIIDA